MAKIILTEKDNSLLNLLSRCGVVKPEQTKTVYGNVSAYHLKRIQKLVALEILVRDHGYVRPTATGLKLAGISVKPLRLERHRYEEHALAAELIAQLPGWTPVYARELKQQNKVQRPSRIAGIISKNNVQYAVYVIADNPKAATLKQLCSEMNELHAADINRVLVFCTSEAIMQTIGGGLINGNPPQGLKECCLLKYPQGINPFRRLFTHEFQTFIRTRFPGMKPCTRPFAHFEWQNAYITIFIHNDMVKRAWLAEYITNVQKRENRRCIVVCSSGQEFDIPGVEIVHDKQ